MENRKRWILTAFSAVLALTVLFTGCGDPEQTGDGSSDLATDSALTDPESTSSEVQSDPASSESDPVSSETTPGGESDPVSSESDPVNSESDPEESESDPEEESSGDEDPGEETTTTTGGTTTGTEDPSGGTIPSAPSIVSLSFKLSDDESFYIVTGMGNYTAAKLVIPAEHEGLPVKEIASEAFKGYRSIEEIEFSSSLKTIGASAFMGCTSLKTLVVPATLETIGASAFEGCSKLNALSFAADRATVLDLGEGAFKACGKLASVSLPANANVISNSLFEDCTALESFSIPANVTSIGDAAFRNCVKLTKIEIGKNVLTVGASAFWGSGVAEIKYAQGATLATIGVNAFRDCAITALTIPATVTEIGDGAFKNCSMIKTLQLPKSVVTLGESAFENCSSLETLTFATDAALKTIGAKAFSGCQALVVQNVGTPAVATLTLPKSVTEIGDAAFFGCAKLQKVIFKDGSQLVTLGGAAFSGCPLITEVSFGKNSQLTVIGQSAFSSCTQLTNVDFGEGSKLETIDSTAFAGCTGLESLTLPETVKTIGTMTFKNCNSLKEIDLKKVETIGEGAFENCVKITEVKLPQTVTELSARAFKGCTALNKLDLNKVTTVGDSAFENCTALNAIAFPTSVTTVGTAAFKGCTGIQTVSLGEALTAIGESAFEGCNALASTTDAESLSIPKAVKTIGKNAFKDCTSLKAITFVTQETVGIESIGESAFENCDQIASVTLPKTLKELGAGAFKNCNALVEVTFAEGAAEQSIGDYAFAFIESEGNSPLTKIIIPATVVSLGKGAFYGCNQLEEITVPFVGEKADGSGITRFDHIFTYTYYDNDTSKDVTLYGVPATLNKVTLTSTTAIPNGAFQNHCGTIKSIVLPSDVTAIGNFAFDGCAALESITLPSKLTTIGDGVFKKCTALKKISIPVKVTSIGVSPFEGCSALNEIKVSANNTAYKVDGNCLIDTRTKTIVAVGNGYTIPTGGTTVTAIGEKVFASTAVTAIEIPEGIVSIADSAFEACTNLEQVKLPKTLTTVGTALFKGCDRLASIIVAQNNSSFKAENASLLTLDGKTLIAGTKNTVIGESVTAIADFAFAGATIESIVIPATVKTIGASAFANCNSLTEITLPFVGEKADAEENTNFAYIFGSEIPASLKKVTVTNADGIAPEAFKNCKNIETVILPESLTSIGASAFAGCEKLASLKLPFVGEKADGTGDTTLTFLFGGDSSKVPVTLKKIELFKCQSIGRNAFKGCKTVETVVLPEELKSIGAFAFDGCAALVGIEIPTGVTTIGAAAFKGCDKFTSITLPFVGEKADGTGNGSFAYIFGESSDSVPATLTEVTLVGCEAIPQEAFKGCKNLTKVTLPDALKTIGAYAFEGCVKITNVKLNMVEELGHGAFKGCSAIESIEVSQDNTAFLVYNNCLIGTVDGVRTLILGCKTSQIPMDVEAIGHEAFAGCTGLESIVIPANVKCIRKNAFAGCTGLTSVTFENNSDWWYADSLTVQSWNKVSTTIMQNPAAALTEQLCAYVWKYEETSLGN